MIEYHYLTKVSKTFRGGFIYGLFDEQGTLIGVCVFSNFAVPELAKGMFGLERNEQNCLYELTRFCLEPKAQQTEHNLASWFLSKCIRLFRKEEKVRAILSYADSEIHKGTIYAAANFKYYGLTDPKPDFWIRQEDGSFIKHRRGPTKGLKGEWRKRSQKHRFAMVFDKNLQIKWEEKRLEHF